jgi:hypothetical protein
MSVDRGSNASWTAARAGHAADALLREAIGGAIGTTSTTGRASRRLPGVGRQVRVKGRGVAASNCDAG